MKKLCVQAKRKEKEMGSATLLPIEILKTFIKSPCRTRRLVPISNAFWRMGRMGSFPEPKVEIVVKGQNKIHKSVQVEF